MQSKHIDIQKKIVFHINPTGLQDLLSLLEIIYLKNYSKQDV